MTDFLTALALAMTIEGVIYALFPGPMRRMMAQLQTQPDQTLRAVGLIGAALGVALVALVRRN